MNFRTMLARMKRTLFPVAALLVLSACGGGAAADPKTPETTASATPATTTAPTTTAPTGNEPLPLAALELKGFGKGTFTLNADGTLLANGKPAGKLEGREIKDADGKQLLALKADGTISYPLGDAVVRIDGSDTLQLPESSAMTVDDDGTLHMKRGDGAAATAHFTGFKPELRRTALVFAFGCYLLMKKG